MHPTNLGLGPDGFGENVHKANPIKQMGASISQTPIPSLLFDRASPGDSGASPGESWGTLAGEVEPNRGTEFAGIEADLGGMMLVEFGSFVFQFWLFAFCGAVVKNPGGIAFAFPR